MRCCRWYPELNGLFNPHLFKFLCPARSVSQATPCMEGSRHGRAPCIDAHLCALRPSALPLWIQDYTLCLWIAWPFPATVRLAPRAPSAWSSYSQSKMLLVLSPPTECTLLLPLQLAKQPQQDLSVLCSHANMPTNAYVEFVEGGHSTACGAHAIH